MAITTKDLIKLLPLGDAFQKELYESYDSLSEDQKLEMERVLWRAHDALFESRLENNLDKDMDDAIHGKKHLDNSAYRMAVEKTKKETQVQNIQQATSDGLSEVRDKLSAIIQNA